MTTKPFCAFALMIGILAAQSPRFETASIKPANPSAPRPGRLGSVPVVTTPGRLTAHNAYLKELIKGAYGVEDYQVSGGPPWIASATFDVEAKATDGANREQLLAMLRDLLADRFRLAVHRETKGLATYALVVGKNGPKFHALTAEQAECWPACEGSPGKTDHMRRKDLASLATFLTRLGSDRPVIDKTGLTGYFALDLEMSKVLEQAQSGDRMFEGAVNVMQDDLGLRLTPAKVPIEVLVIDHAEKPSGN